MKKTYIEPEFELTRFLFEEMLSGGVVHTSFEQGGGGSFEFDDGDDEGFEGW